MPHTATAQKAEDTANWQRASPFLTHATIIMIMAHGSQAKLPVNHVPKYGVFTLSFNPVLDHLGIVMCRLAIHSTAPSASQSLSCSQVRKQKCRLGHFMPECNEPRVDELRTSGAYKQIQKIVVEHPGLANR
jgi:hypothetical protein